jgi:hypothetical protein
MANIDSLGFDGRLVTRRRRAVHLQGASEFVTIEGGDYFFIPSLRRYACSPRAVSTRVEAAPSCAGSSRASKADVRAIVYDGAAWTRLEVARYYERPRQAASSTSGSSPSAASGLGVRF